MSQPASIPTEVNDFFSSFYRQSEASHGKLTSSSYATVPLESDKTLDEYVAKSQEAKQAQLQSAPQVVSTPQPQAVVQTLPAPTTVLATPSNTPTVQQSADTTDKAQKLAMWLPRGGVPTGYTVATSCANCEYFCGGYNEGRGVCTKFDFACSINYTCDEFELVDSCASGEATELYSDSPKEQPQVLSEPLVAEMQATVTNSSYVGDTFLTVEDAQLQERLRAIAEKRVSLIATKEGRSPLPDEVEKELLRILQARLTPKTA